MRQYQPIWNRIKEKKYASLTAPLHNHARIIKAVTKEKYMDEGYKLLLDNKCLRAVLLSSIDTDNPELIHFTLTLALNNNIGVSDL